MTEDAVRTSRLPCGLRVVTAELPHVESVAVGLWIAAGTRDEPAELAGAAHFLEHMLFKGTTSRSARRIAEEIENVGGTLDAHTSREYTAYHARVLAEDLPLALDLISDMILHATLSEEDLRQEREVILREMGEVADTPDEFVFDLFQECAFPGQSLGWPVLGRPETVRSMAPEALRGFWRSSYTGSRSVLVAAGRVRHEDVVTLAEAHLAALPAGEAPERPRARYVGGVTGMERNLDQLHLVLGFPAVPITDPRYFPLQLLSQILGGGMSSRFFQEVREERGLAYSIYSFVSGYSDAGLFGVYGSTEPGRAPELVELVWTELRNFGRGLRKGELERARKQLEAAVRMSRESCGAVAEDLARQMLLFGRWFSRQELIGRIRKVKEEDVLRLAADLFTGETLSLAWLGAGTAIAPQLERGIDRRHAAPAATPDLHVATHKVSS